MTNRKKSQKPTENFGTKLKLFLKTNYKLLIFLSIFFILNCALLAINCVHNGVITSSKRFIFGITAIVIINIILCIFIFFVKHRSWPIEKIFLVIGAVLGTLYLFAIPMGRVPDEPAHIWRTYSIVQGDILTENQDEINGNLLPENIANFGAYYVENAYSSLADRLSEPISDNQIFHETITSNPIDYLPQIIGMFIGRILQLPMIVVFYLARFCGLITCLVIMYYCLKYIPILKKPLFFISCLPLTMQTFVAISYDGMIFCSATALITFVLYTIYQSNFRLNFTHYFLITILSILLISVKPVYFPICLLLFFIPARCFKNKKQKIFTILAILFITISTLLIWSKISIITQPGNGADTSGQISYILSNPIKYIVILIQNILNMPFIYLQRLGSLEWLDVHINDFYIIGTLICFVILCIKERFMPIKLKLSKSFRYAVLAVAIITTIFIYTALYIQWTQVGAPIIEGVQTRYLLPIFIAIPLLCYSSDTQHPRSKKELIYYDYLCGFLIFLNFNAITLLFCMHI